jgi:hypothetical protein
MQMSPKLPLVSCEGRVKLEPVAILDRRVIKKDNAVEVLIQWSNLDMEDAIWELYDDLKQQFDLEKHEDKLMVGLLMDTVVHGLNGLDISWIRVDHVVLGHQPKTQTQPNSKI